MNLVGQMAGAMLFSGSGHEPTLGGGDSAQPAVSRRISLGSRGCPAMR